MDGGSNLLRADISHNWKEWLLKTSNSQYNVTITKSLKTAYVAVDKRSLSSIYTLRTASSGRCCYNLRDVIALQKVLYKSKFFFLNPLHKLLNRVWAWEQIIYISICFNIHIENTVKPSLFLSFKVYYHEKLFNRLIVASFHIVTSKWGT